MAQERIEALLEKRSVLLSLEPAKEAHEERIKIEDEISRIISQANASASSDFAAGYVGIMPSSTQNNPPPGVAPTSLTMHPASPINVRPGPASVSGEFRFPARSIADLPPFNFTAQVEVETGVGPAWVTIASAWATVTQGSMVDGTGLWSGTTSGGVGSGQWRARMRYTFGTGAGAWSPWSAWFNFTTTDLAPLAPTNLSPTFNQNRREPIELTWTHRPGVQTDTQQGSEVEFWQGTGTRTIIQGGTANRAIIPANTFLTEAAVNFRARTWVNQVPTRGAWSEPSSFPLIVINHPQAPTGLQPTVAQNPTRMFRLEWTHVPAATGASDSQDGSEVEYWQGTGPRTILEGEFGNRVTIMADTFTFLPGGTVAQNTISFRARTHGLRGGWGPWSTAAGFQLALDPPLAPVELTPTTTQNPRIDIELRWRHNPNPTDRDSQISAQVRYRQGSTGAWIYELTDISNRMTIPAGTFVVGAAVQFQVRTQVQRNGWGAWSNIVSFALALDPPQAPIELQPTALQNPRTDIELRWRHVGNASRPFDTQTGTQIAYQQWGGSWTTVTLTGDTTNRFVLQANTFTNFTSINWQVRTSTVLGDWGAWSSTHTFPLGLNPPLAPTVTAPDSANRYRDIRVSWRHNASRFGDMQTDSQLEARQGVGPVHIFDGGTANNAIVPGGTFSSNVAISVRARTQSVLGDWGAWSAAVNIALFTAPPLAPTSLAPTDQQNRRTTINLSWRHTPNPADWDTQANSQVEYWQDNNIRTQIYAGTGNRLELPNDTFTDNRTVFFRVRTQGQANGWSPWSAVASFSLSSFQSLPPTELRPYETRNPRIDIPLTWRFNANPRWFSNDGQTDSQVEVWQGTGARITIRGYQDNRAVVAANTFTALTPISFRARTYTNLGGWGDWSEVQTFDLAISPPLPPIDVRPTTPQNPRGQIRVSWTHAPNPDMPGDVQTDSQIRIRQANRGWQIFSGGAENVVYVPAFTFTAFAFSDFPELNEAQLDFLNRAEVMARTHSEINGWGPWSAIEGFDLRMTPPSAPVLTHPVNIAVRAADGIFLQWSYNSPYDIFPSRFDIRYRIGDGEWVELRTDSQGGGPAPTSIMTSAETAQSRIEWQVRAWGELGDAGEWSDTAQAFIIGIPLAPAISHITNSGRPEIHFSAQNATAWEIEILQGGQVIYATGERAFTGDFIHVAEQFFPNGSYAARLRVSNEYGIYSEWATRAFVVNVTLPAAIELTAANSFGFHIQLLFDGIGRVGYVYRAPLINDNFTEHGDFIRIARVENVDNFEDWTARPNQRYKYFIRVVSENFGFADSNIETAKVDFKETTIAVTDSPHDMLKLLSQLGNKPTKDSSFQQEKTLTHFSGREKPVLQTGSHTDRVKSLAFYVSLADRDRLEELAKSDIALILRDWRLGVVYGAITSGTQAQSDGFGPHVYVSFALTECDYPIEVDIR